MLQTVWATVQGGQIQFSEHADLPEGAKLERWREYIARIPETIITSVAGSGTAAFYYAVVSLLPVDARVKSAVRIPCRTTAGHSSLPLEPPAKPT